MIAHEVKSKSFISEQPYHRKNKEQERHLIIDFRFRPHASTLLLNKAKTNGCPNSNDPSMEFLLAFPSFCCCNPPEKQLLTW
jgi:hypothetical protein